VTALAAAPDETAGTVGLTTAGAVTTLTIDRPAKLNALTPELLASMATQLRRVAQSDARVLLLRTGGGRAFCVGADLHRFAALGPLAVWRDWTRLGHEVFDLLSSLPQVTVAVVHGDAFGGGLELALATDFRVVSETARLGLPETRLGTVPGWGGTERLTAMVGASRAKLVCLANRHLSARTAFEWGLATVLAPDSGGIEEAVAGLVDDVLAAAPVATTLAKQLIDACAAGVPARLLEPLAGALTASTDDLREGIAAFRERRGPTFRGL
jgi:enoyl-CoA hydratase